MCQLLTAYMEQPEKMPLTRSNNIHVLEEFAHLMTITVVELQAEEKDRELGDGTLLAYW